MNTDDTREGALPLPEVAECLTTVSRNQWEAQLRNQVQDDTNPGQSWDQSVKVVHCGDAVPFRVGGR